MSDDSNIIMTEAKAKQFTEQGYDLSAVARVAQEHKELYVLVKDNAFYQGEITGAMRYSASSREDFPAVGDWVAIAEYDENKAIIHNIFPRQTEPPPQPSS